MICNEPSIISEVVWVQSVRVRVSLTLDGSQDDAGVVVGDDVGVTIFGLVHLQVGMFPGELLARIDGLTGSRDGRNMHTHKEEIRRALRRVEQ